jgi:hypothetical protein
MALGFSSRAQTWFASGHTHGLIQETHIYIFIFRPVVGALQRHRQVGSIAFGFSSRAQCTAMLQRCFNGAQRCYSELEPAPPTQHNPATAPAQPITARTTHSTQPHHGTSPTHHHSIPTTTTITTTTITTAPLSCAGVWQYMQKVCTQFRHAHPTHGISCGMQNSGQWVCVPIDQNRDILIQNTI